MNTVFGGKLCLGRVKFFEPNKYWGFIIEDVTFKEYYVSRAGIMDTTLEVGDRVTFEIVRGPRELEATEVR